MANQIYTDHEIEEFLELAKEMGITRAMRELGYPKSWATADNWAKARDLHIDVDSLKSAAAAAREWYKDEEVIRVAEAGMERVFDELNEKELEPDEIKKLSEAYQKFSNQWLVLKGKTQTISESRSVGETDLIIKDMIAAEHARNALIEKEVKSN